MKRIYWPALLALPLFSMLMTGCGGSTPTEDVSTDTSVALKKIGSILDGVDDEAAAKAAVPQIQAQLSEFNAQKANFDALKLSPEDVKKGEALIASAKVELASKLDALKARSAAAYRVVEPEVAKLGKLK